MTQAQTPPTAETGAPAAHDDNQLIAERREKLKALREEEGASSITDLSEIRRKWREENKLEEEGLPEHNKRPIRNHGLFSKAEHTLQIAGWSEKARNDVEVFALIDTEGLTPLLMVLNDADRGTGRAQQPPATAA